MRLFILSVVAAILAHQSGAALQQSPSEDFRGTIRGIVKLAGQPDGIAGVSVQFGRADSRTVSTRTTDSAGRFEFRDLPSGFYEARVKREGYFNLDGSSEIASQSFMDRDHPSPLLAITMVKGSMISGKLTDDQGRPIEGMEVNPLRVGYREGQTVLNPITPTNGGTGASGAIRALTDNQGVYRLYWIAPGEYYIRVREDTRAGRGNIGTNSRQDLAAISYYPGTADLLAATRISLNAGQELSGFDLKIPLRAGVTISGKVVNNAPGGTPQTNGQYRRTASVYLLRRGAPEIVDSGSAAANLQTQTGDLPRNMFGDENPFRISGALPGLYELLSIFVDASTPTMHAGRSVIEVQEHNIGGVVAMIRPNEPVKGRVVFRDSIANFKWDTIAVQLRPMDIPIALLNPGWMARVSNDGTFELPSLIAARYRVLAIGLQEDTYVAGIRLGTADVYENPTIAIADDPIPQLEITLSRAGGIVRGTVHNSNGESAPGSSVVLIPQASHRGNPNLYKRTSAGPDGSFTLRGIAPGEYRIFAWEFLPFGGAEENSEFLGPYETQGKLLTVEEGTSNVAITISVIPAYAPR